MRLGFLLLLFSILASQVFAQTGSPSPTFGQEVLHKTDSSLTIRVTAILPKGLRLFSSKPNSTDQAFNSQIQTSDELAYKILSIEEQGHLQTTIEPNSGLKQSYFEDSVGFIIKLAKLKNASELPKLIITWLANQGDEYPAGETILSIDPTNISAPKAEKEESADKLEKKSEEPTKSLWRIFIEGFLAGLGAFIMPCIYAMIPVTVSFFTKRSKTRAQGIKNALVYTASIITIFTIIGFLITVLFGKGALNNLASSAWFNVGVFILFLVFGISFLGAFEINLPPSWSNAIDKKSGLNSYTGIFFLALTLVIVSFSCTVPFIGALTVLISKGSFWAPLVGFFAFSLALALPFALFTIFPGLLNGLGKSGSWLNSLKVSLGFIELALALKFLSSADLAYHWGLLDRDVYLSLWIVIFGLLGLYLLGKLRFHHDDDLPLNDYGKPYLTVTRLFFAIAALSFTVYMIPGLWGAPLNAISAWIPEMKTQDFILTNQPATTGSTGQSKLPAPVKYANLLGSEIPGVQTYFDYEEAIGIARQFNKPLMIDFTGHACANCRKMEREVLSDPRVMKKLQEDFVVVSLYVDDKHPLPQNEWKKSDFDGKLLKRMGEKNLDFEVTLTQNNAQPFYVFVNNSGQLLSPNGYGYNPNIGAFMAHLDEMLRQYQNHRN